MNDPLEQQLIADLARAQVAQLAPDELPLFRPTCEAYFVDPQKTLEVQHGKDEMLGFGPQAALVFLTPVVLAVSAEVVKYLIVEIGKALKTQSAELIGETIKNLFKPLRKSGEPAPPTVPRLTSEQLEQVRRLALERALHLNLPENQAKLLVDALVGGLLVSG